MSKPLYEHDCPKCTFLGTFYSIEHEAVCDLYHCPQGGFATVIARYSSDLPDYSSGMEFGRLGIHSDLTEAHERAKRRGLIEETDNEH